MDGGFDVLLVDDDSATLDALGSLLESHGYTVRMADSAADALHIIRTQRPRVVLTDVVMPGTSGTELVHQLRQEPGLDRLPFVLMSGREPPRDDEPVLAWIRKPLHLPELLKAIEPVVRA